MNTLYRWAAKSPNYINAFGLLYGLRLLFAIERSVPKKSPQLNQYNVPGQAGPIYLRKTISDHSIFWQCIVQRQYDMFRFPQGNRLMSVYRNLLEKDIRPLIIDCGGNIGMATLDLARLFPEALIYVIEPDIENFEILKKISPPWATA